MAKVKPPDPPQVVIIAGPNGAGKTSYAESVLAVMGVYNFVNADRIAQGLSGIHPELVAIQAGRIMLERLSALAETRTSFAFETTLSSRSFAPFLRRLGEAGYLVRIFYLMLPNPQESVWRVKNRVALGGHSIPKEVIVRRFSRSAHNFFELYLPLADTWRVSENKRGAGPDEVARGSKFGQTITDGEAWQRLHRIAKKN